MMFEFPGSMFRFQGCKPIAAGMRSEWIVKDNDLIDTFFCSLKIFKPLLVDPFASQNPVHPFCYGILIGSPLSVMLMQIPLSKKCP